MARLMGVALFMLALPGVTAADPVFRLCRGNVAQAALAGEGAGFVVHVRLTEPAALAFAELTGRVRGRGLTVLAGGEVFSRATVRAVIDGGRLVSAPRARAAADDLLRAIRQSRPEAECGAGAGDAVPAHVIRQCKGSACRS